MTFPKKLFPIHEQPILSFFFKEVTEKVCRDLAIGFENGRKLAKLSMLSNYLRFTCYLAKSNKWEKYLSCFSPFAYIIESIPRISLIGMTEAPDAANKHNI
jgi:hypothetical protein